MTGTTTSGSKPSGGPKHEVLLVSVDGFEYALTGKCALLRRATGSEVWKYFPTNLAPQPVMRDLGKYCSVKLVPKHASVCAPQEQPAAVQSKAPPQQERDEMKGAGGDDEKHSLPEAVPQPVQGTAVVDTKGHSLEAARQKKKKNRKQTKTVSFCEKDDVCPPPPPLVKVYLSGGVGRKSFAGFKNKSKLKDHLRETSAKKNTVKIEFATSSVDFIVHPNEASESSPSALARLDKNIHPAARGSALAGGTLSQHPAAVDSRDVSLSRFTELFGLA